MTIRTACITAGAAALALPAFAGTPKIQANGAGLATPQSIQPIRAAKYAIIDGQMVLTTDWMYANNGPSTRGPVWTYVFDNIEISPADPNAAPDFTDACGLAGGRWLLYTTDVATFDYCNPFATNDMSALSQSGLEAIDGMYLLWYQRAALPGSPPVPEGEQLFIAVQLFETTILDDCSVAEPADFVDGVILDFGVNANGFWYSAVDLSAFAISMAAPADGSGSYQYIFGNAFDGTTITLSTCVQSGLWGTAAPRVGTQTLVQYDDDNPTDGLHDTAFECYDYTYGVCPDPLGAAIGLMNLGEGTGCPCPGDFNGDSIRDISDLAIILSEFGSTNGGCDDINGDGVTDISDLAAFLSTFGVPC
jgi:hypothetical protein